MIRIALIALLIAFGANSADGCSCMRALLEKSFKQSDLVIKGKVLKIELVESVDSAAIKYYLNHGGTMEDVLKPDIKRIYFHEFKKITVEVARTFKGLGKQKSTTLFTSSNEAACGYDFQIGETYLVFCNHNDYLFGSNLLGVDPKAVLNWTGRCSNNAVYSEETEKELSKLQKQLSSNRK